MTTSDTPLDAEATKVLSRADLQYSLDDLVAQIRRLANIKLIERAVMLPGPVYDPASWGVVTHEDAEQANQRHARIVARGIAMLEQELGLTSPTPLSTTPYR